MKELTMSSELMCAREYYADGTLMREWFTTSYGRQHNDAGPAVRWWHKNGQLAIEEYYLKGWRHNAAGPAWSKWRKNGELVFGEYWLDGRELQKAEWEARVKPAA
jgi:hypothetical protein